jgi:DNA-binding GntR family transcriptional regulator
MTTATEHVPDRARARVELNADYTPQYIKAARLVRARIEDGTYPVFRCVPGSRALAAELGFSQLVVLHGLTILVRAGYLRHVEAKPHQVIWDGHEDKTEIEQRADGHEPHQRQRPPGR